MSTDMLHESALLGCEQMAASDRWTIRQGHVRGIDLMDRAGAAIARVVQERFAETGPVHVLCGPGNNGGDGYVVARLLAAAGRDVALHALSPPKPGTDAEIAAALWSGDIRALEAFCPDAGTGLVIDALFGAGFRGHLPEPVVAALHRMAASGARRLAVDVPSGLSGDTGLSELAIGYDATVTFYRRKPGHVSGAGPVVCGDVIVSDIGVRADPESARAPAAFENGPALWRAHVPRRARETHKYRQGHVAVFSGPVLRTGAARLSALAAARSGAGAVTLLGSRTALAEHAAHVTSIMLASCEAGNVETVLDGLNGVRSVVLGPGFTHFEDARVIARHCLERGGTDAPLPVVLDADGITAFAAAPAELFTLTHRQAVPSLVLTPHHGEFARLFPDIAADETLGNLARAKLAAARARAVILYKGAETVIASPGDAGCAAITTNGTPALATAGSGDVLAGLVAGLMAQRMPPFHAACAGAWLHAEAGRHAGPVCIAEDLVDALKSVCAPFLG